MTVEGAVVGGVAVTVGGVAMTMAGMGTAGATGEGGSREGAVSGATTSAMGCGMRVLPRHVCEGSRAP